MDRRRPGQSKFTTQRKESDKIHILSGVFNGRTTGTPISIIIHNEDKRSRDYESIKEKFRPGHADFTYFKNTVFVTLGVAEDNLPERLLVELPPEQLQELF